MSNWSSPVVSRATVKRVAAPCLVTPVQTLAGSRQCRAGVRMYLASTGSSQLVGIVGSGQVACPGHGGSGGHDLALRRS
jgi:hypothetical protein